MNNYYTAEISPLLFATTSCSDNPKIKSPNITDIQILKYNKVVEISFADGGKEKMVRHEDDKFDLRKCCFIAIAKHLYKETYTFEGIEYMAG